MFYEVKIEDQDGEEVIYIGNPENEGEGKMITSLVVELDTINDQSRQKSNAMLAKATLPEATIRVIADCCAGVSPDRHNAALEAMDYCQIEIV